MAAMRDSRVPTGAVISGRFRDFFAKVGKSPKEQWFQNPRHLWDIPLVVTMIFQKLIYHSPNLFVSVLMSESGNGTFFFIM